MNDLDRLASAATETPTAPDARRIVKAAQALESQAVVTRVAASLVTIASAIPLAWLIAVTYANGSSPFPRPLDAAAFGGAITALVLGWAAGSVIRVIANAATLQALVARAQRYL